VTQTIRNIVANYTGSILPALLSLVLIPFYISKMGIEGYALVGVFAALQALFAPLDAGLSVTVMRELAVRSAAPERASRDRVLVRTTETLYWAMALLIGAAVAALAPLIATHWLGSSHISRTVLTQSLILIGVTSMFQWPLSFYTGALYGLQKQITANAINVIAATINGVGSVLVLTLSTPSVSAFFQWQAVAYGLHTAALCVAVWRALPAGDPARFDRNELRGIWRFAAGANAVTLLAVVLTQVDKVVLSRLLTLELFGYYTLAGVAAGSLYRLVGPLSQALFPRFTALVAMRDWEGLENAYHRGSQLMSVLVFPIAVVISTFSYELLLAWTHNARTATNAAAILSVLVIGTMLHSTLFLPYQLQLAYGWVSLGICVNAVAVVAVVPLMIVLTGKFGAVGAAFAWLILNVGYFTVSIPIMHSRLLPNAKWPWYFRDVLLPLAASVVVIAAARAIVPRGLTVVQALMAIGIAGAAASLSAAMSAPEIRLWIGATLRRRIAS
jgi:O-antigen/teichoic acid export membrane protein